MTDCDKIRSLCYRIYNGRNNFKKQATGVIIFKPYSSLLLLSIHKLERFSFFQPSLIFAGNAGALVCRLGWQDSLRTNTLAYLWGISVTKEKMFMTLKSGACIIKRITAVIFGFRNKLECLSINTRLGWKGLPGTNTLAYYRNRKLRLYLVLWYRPLDFSLFGHDDKMEWVELQSLKHWWVFSNFLSKVLQTSYELHVNFLSISLELLRNFIGTS